MEPRIRPSEAARISAENLLPHLATVERVAWGGRKIYPARILNCASKCDANRIYTINLSDFHMLAPATIRERICAHNGWQMVWV